MVHIPPLFYVAVLHLSTGKKAKELVHSGVHDWNYD